ncbi:MAG: LysM peptidoglycan-binding domain-containing protein [Bacteroidales bacterium]|nr:LysM peptidoglycan-binding domain-containing protein [Bacteroidales bacterium]
MNRHLIAISAAICLITAFPANVSAQDYIAPKVEVSTEKVRNNGKLYYSHIVKERQTLYSISKAYGVTIQEIYDCNQDLNLRNEGLKSGQVLLIPAKEQPFKFEPVKSSSAKEAARQAAGSAQQEEEYFIHKVKWFEDINAIAKKYGVSVESIININGMTSDKLKRKQELKIPIHPEKWEGANAMAAEPQPKSQEIPEEEIKDTIPEQRKTIDDISDDIVVNEGVHAVIQTLLLPFNDSEPSGNKTSCMDFYSGVLLAAKDLGEAGTDIDLSVYDASMGAIPVSREKIAKSHFAIGPIKREGLKKAVTVCDGNTWVVSPLDLNVESLTDSIAGIIQAPTPTAYQIKDMVRWIKSDLKSSDKVIVIVPQGSNTAYAAQVEKEMEAIGLKHVTTTYGNVSPNMTTTGTNRIVLACNYNRSDKSFLSTTVRNLYSMLGKKADIVLYGTARLRTYEEIEVENLHKLKLHLCVQYYTDSNSAAVERFNTSYRSLFNGEPSRSSYSGYDLMKYFTILAAKYGDNWPKGMDKVRFTGLQSDFDLHKTESGSYVNQAVRRVLYMTNFTTKLVK